MNAGIEMLCNRVLGALLNGGYQGLLLTALVWVGLKLVPRTNAATRHTVSLAALLLVALLPVVHFVLPKVDSTAAPELNDFGIHNEFSSLTLVSQNLPDPSTENNLRSSEVAQVDAREQEDPPEPQAAVAASEEDQVRESLVLNPELGDPASPTTSESVLERFSRAGFFPLATSWWLCPVPKMIGIGLTVLWIVFASTRMGNLAWQYGRLRRLKRQGVPPNRELRALFEDLRNSARIKRNPAVVVCAEPAVPMVAGFWNPAVLLPATIVQNARRAQIEHILRHELAHVARGDDWANLVQQIIKGILFFHPAVWWLSRRLTIEREIACDDHVLSATPARQAYALFLTEFARRTQCRDWVAAPAAWSKRSQLTERITMILDSKRNASPQLARVKTGILTTAAALLAIWGLRAGPRVALAAEGAENKPAKIEATEETKNVTEVHSDSIVAPSAGLPTAHSDSSTISTFSGPRVKPGPHPTAAIAANPAPEPVPPSNSFALAAPGEPEAPGQPEVPAAVPHRPRAVVRLESGYKGHDEDSLERRLDRLERMVETLMAREKVKPKMKGQEDFAYNYKAPNFSFAPDGKGSVKWDSGIPSDEDLARLKDLAKRQAELASRNAQRAAREMEKTTREIARSAEDAKLKAELGGQDNSDNSRQDNFEVQRRQLEATRKVLEKQMHALEKQISRLDEEREKANEQRDGDHDKRMNRLNRNLDSLKRDSVPAEEAPGKKQKSDSEVPN